MKPNIDPEFPSIAVVCLVFCSSLIALYAGVIGIQSAIEGLNSGWVYSMSIVFNIKRMVYRDASPIEYWQIVIFYGLIGVSGSSLGIVTPVLNFLALRKKIQRKRDERRNQADRPNI
jgi:hypothetical protein